MIELDNFARTQKLINGINSQYIKWIVGEYASSTTSSRIVRRYLEREYTEKYYA